MKNRDKINILVALLIGFVAIGASLWHQKERLPFPSLDAQKYVILLVFILSIAYLFRKYNAYGWIERKVKTCKGGAYLEKINTVIGIYLKKISGFFVVLYQKIYGVISQYFISFKTNPRTRKNTFIVLGGILTVVLTAYIWNITRPVYLSPNDLNDTYTLTRENVPFDGPIIVRLPEGIEKSGARGDISFDPPIKTRFARTLSSNHIVFKLKDELEIGNNYKIIFDAEDGSERIEQNFRAVERPRIDLFLPEQDSIVTDEYTAISFLFNRPMVPLQSLDRMYEKELPIFIKPETEGHFKWVSERYLQFIPEEHLQRSSKYSVTVGESFMSVDGLQVAPDTYTFTVLPLVKTYSSIRTLAYDVPIRISFNQPVDIERMQIEVLQKKEKGSDERVEVDIEYASRLTYNPKLKQKERIFDRSSVVISPKSDDLGRAGFWDFDTQYEYELSEIYPLEGDIFIDEPIKGSISINKFVRSMRAVSKRSTFVSHELFDPQGELRFNLYEEIDIEKSIVSGKGVKNIEYEMRCVKEERNLGKDVCKKEKMYDTILVSFDDSVFSKGEVFDVIFERAVTRRGIDLLIEPQIVTLTTIPKLEITKITPEDGDKKASVSTLMLCSTVPLKRYDEEDYASVFKSDKKIKFNSWQRSQKVPGSYRGRNGSCGEGEYMTNIYYSLMAETSYDISLRVDDQFGGSAQRSVSFITQSFKKDSGKTKPVLLFGTMNRKYSVTVPQKTKFTLFTENFKEIEVSICKLSPSDMISAGRYANQRDELPFKCLSKKTLSVDFPKEKFKRHYFTVDLKDYFADTRGHYAISFTHPDYVYEKYIDRKKIETQRYDHIFTSVTNISLVEKKTNRVDLARSHRQKNSLQTNLLEKNNMPTNLYWAADISTLDPIKNATVFVYQNKSSQQKPNNVVFATSTKTNFEGIARSPIIIDVAGAYVVSGDETAIVSNWADTLNRSSQAYEFEKTYLYTDRPIYRPGHEVFIKGLHRIGYDGDFEVLAGRKIKVEVRNSRGDIIKKTDVQLNDYGTFDISFKLKKDAPLGTYSVRGARGMTRFDVEEFVRSPFKVEIASEEDEYTSGDIAEIRIDAKHFFGVPIQKGEVSYSIMSQDYFFDRSKDKRFRFDSNWYGCRSCSYGDKFIARGKAELKNGQVTISQETNFETLFEKDEKARRKSKIFVIRAVVKDSQGRSVSGQTSFIVHSAQYYTSVRFTKPFVEENKTVPFEVKTVNTKGYGVAKSGITLRAERVEWQKYRRQEVDGEFYYKWEEVRTPTHDILINTNTQGDYVGSIAFPSAGQYEITLSGKDARGNALWSQRTLYVYGDDVVSVKPSNDRTLDIAVEQKDYDVGDAPKIIIQSPYQKAKALVTVERGTVMDYEVIDVERSFFDYDFRIRDEHIPNVVVSVVLLSPEPEIKYGEVRLNINRKNKELNINVLSNKQSYIPGERVTLDIYTTSRAGAPMPAEVSVAVVDMSVLALKGNPVRKPLEFFYSGLPHGVITSSNLKHVHEEIEIPTGTKGGGGSVSDLEKKKRGIFKDTAFWSAKVLTGANGYGTITFTLPDNLTKWRIETIGITKDTKVGVDYLEFEEKKKIMTLPLLPRFIIPGDEFEIGALVMNQTRQAQNISVSFESDTLEMIGKARSVHYIPSGSSKTVYAKVRAPLGKEAGTHTVLLSAKGFGFEDTVEKIIPITENTTYETVSLASFADGDTATAQIYTPENIHANAGGLKIRANSTVAAFLEDSLNYMIAFPYGCSEQLASKISTLATVVAAANIENIGKEFAIDTIEFRGVLYTVDEAIETGLARIYETQTSSGGFAYYNGLEPNFSLSLHILSVFEELRTAGVGINQSSYDAVLAYVLKESKKIKVDKSQYKKNIYALDNLLAATYPLTNIDPTPKSVNRQISAIRAGITKKNLKNISSTGLGYAALLSDRLRFWDRRNVWKEIDRRLGLDVDGVFVKSNRENIQKDYYETGVKNTALVLQAIMKQKKPHKEYKNILKWLLAQRYQNGAWINTNTTQVMVQTLSQYITWKDEQNADYELNISLNEEPVGKYDTQKDSRIYGFETNISFEDLGLGEKKDIFFQRVARGDRADTFYYDISMKYYLDRDIVPARDEGVRIDRQFYSINDTARTEPLREAKVGDVVVGRIVFNSTKTMHLFGLEDVLPAGLEPINFTLATEDKIALDSAIDSTQYEPEEPVNVSLFMKTQQFKDMEEVEVYKDSRNKKGVTTNVYNKTYRPNFKEFHDDRIFLFSEKLSPGLYVYEYYARALVPGVFQHLPASASELYNPEFFGRTSGRTFIINK